MCGIRLRLGKGMARGNVPAAACPSTSGPHTCCPGACLSKCRYSLNAASPPHRGRRLSGEKYDNTNAPLAPPHRVRCPRLALPAERLPRSSTNHTGKEETAQTLPGINARAQTTSNLAPIAYQRTSGCRSHTRAYWTPFCVCVFACCFPQ